MNATPLSHYARDRAAVRVAEKGGWPQDGMGRMCVCEKKFVTYTVVRTRTIQAVQNRSTNDQHVACVERRPSYFSQAFYSYMSMSQPALYLRKRTVLMT